MASLALTDVTKVFDDGGEEIVAVDDLDLEIEDGEFLVLVGPSGCGKSTTLRMIAGLETPSSGTITLDGEDISHRTAQERDIAMVFQSYALYPHMNVRGNMAFGLTQSTDMSSEEIDDRVERTADTLDIADLLDRKPSELSGGQQQRVALGRSIVREPKAFLMDEPLSNLDAKLRAQMRMELQQIQDDLGTTTVYVTHDQTEAMTMSDRIAILDGGRLQQVGTPMECYHEPANQFVAGFLGEPAMNFFDVTLEDGRLVGDGFAVDVSESTRSSVAGADDLVLGIRPETVEITDTTDDPAAFPGVIEVVEPYGDENAVHLYFQERETEKGFTAVVDGMRRFEGGQNVGVSFPEDTLHLFDGATGEALRHRVIQNVEGVEEIGTV